MTEGGHGGQHIAALDGLRALAVVAVLLFHADLGVVRGGFLGVSVFFTLSGFLITRLLLDEHSRSGSISIRDFYARRARRLVPAAYLCILGVVAAGAWWSATQRRDLPGDVVAAVANVANWRFALAERSYQDLFIGDPSPLAHFWSLAIEEQCYLLLPLVAWWALRRGGVRMLGITLGALLVASTLATLLTSDADIVYNGTHTRAAELLMGALLAVAIRRRAVPGGVSAIGAVGGLAVLALLCSTVDLSAWWLYRGGFVAISVVSALTVAGLLGSHPAARLVGARPLVAIGRRSYGVYLFHWPVFLLLSAERTGLATWPLFALRLTVTAAVAVASFRWWESPVRSRRLLVRPSLAPAMLGLGAVGLVVLAVSAVPAPRFSRTEELLALGDAEAVTFSPPVTNAAVASTASEPSKAVTVLVVGSVSAAVDELRRAGFDVVDGVQDGCPIAPAAAVRFADGTELDTSACTDNLARWPDLLKSVAPDVVVVAGGPLDAGLGRDADETGFPTELRDIAAGLARAERRTAAALDTVLRRGVPVVVYNAAPPSDGPAGILDRLALTAGSVAGGVVHRIADLPDSVRRALAPPPDHPPLRLLVVGDSTSLDMAQALSDAGGSLVAVTWAGANGCPFVRAEATRAGRHAPWREGGCPDFAVTLPPILASAAPDLVLVVAGPTELQAQRYPGDPRTHTAGEPAYTKFHDAEMAAFLAVVGDTPVVVADAPPIRAGDWATPAMASPERLAAWNAQIARWDASSDHVSILPYSAALGAYEQTHGDTRTDGVHPEVGALTEIARRTLLPYLQALVAPPAVVVIGDSTSLVAAKALADGADGRLVVHWAGQEGCPLVPAVAARPAHDATWRELECRDVVTGLRSSLAEYQPDAVVVVVGAMELMEQRYADGTAHLPGTPAYDAVHDATFAELLGAARAAGVRLVVADTPPLGVGSYSSFEMADPARAAAFNAMVARWDAANDDVMTLDYAAPLLDYEAVHGNVRFDGSHPDIDVLTGIARDELVPALLDLLAAPAG